MSASSRGETSIWPDVLGRIIQGYTHEFNNRLLVLVGVRDLLEPNGPVDPALLELLDREIDGFETSNRLIRQLVVPDDAPEVVATADLLTGVRTLHSRHRGLEEVAVEWRLDDAAPTIEVVPSALVRALVLVLAGAAEPLVGAGSDDGSEVVTVRAEAEGDALLLTVTPWPDDPAALAAAAAVLEDPACSIEAGDGACRIRAPGAGSRG